MIHRMQLRVRIRLRRGGNLGSEKDEIEVIKETQMEEDGDDERVTVSISNAGLADGLRPLKKTNIEVRLSAQTGTGGPVNVGKQPLRDVTNNFESSQRGPGAIRTYRRVQGQKRPIQSPYEKPVAVKNSSDGPVRGRPPDPVRTGINLLEVPGPKPNLPNDSTKLGEEAGADTGANVEETEDIVPMEIPMEAKDAEGGDATQSSL